MDLHNIRYSMKPEARERYRYGSEAWCKEKGKLWDEMRSKRGGEGREKVWPAEMKSVHVITRSTHLISDIDCC